jgi:hypothetical protein
LDLTVMTEAEMASMQAEEGLRVVQRDGRYWCAIFPGFYQPVHLLARLRAAEIRRPTHLCWGYRAALSEEDVHLANGSIPVHLMTDIGQFTECALNESRRRDLRKCRRDVQLRRVHDPSLLVDQGYGVFVSAQRRVPYWPDLTEDAYRRRMGRRACDKRRLIVVGLIGGRLAGYLESHAVDGVLYADEIFVATEALCTGIGTGLYVEAIKIAAGARSVDSVCIGLETPERPSLDAFKDGLGLPVVQVPARSSIPPAIGAFIRARRPASHYRLTGVEQPVDQGARAREGG